MSLFWRVKNLFYFLKFIRGRFSIVFFFKLDSYKIKDIIKFF